MYLVSSCYKGSLCQAVPRSVVFYSNFGGVMAQLEEFYDR